MGRKTTFFSLLFLLVGLAQVSAQDIFGKWKTIDDETGKAKSIVEIYEKDGKAYGRVTQLLNRSADEDPNPVCDKCKGARKDKKVIGMNIITAMEKDGKEWKDGEIMDPENGKVYDCKIWRDGDKLQVRGYVAFFFRTQTWLPVKD